MKSNLLGPIYVLTLNFIFPDININKFHFCYWYYGYFIFLTYAFLFYYLEFFSYIFRKDVFETFLKKMFLFSVCVNFKMYLLF